MAAFQETNHIFVPIGRPSATIPTDTCAAQFGFPAKTSCIAVYAHESEDTNSHNQEARRVIGSGAGPAFFMAVPNYPRTLAATKFGVKLSHVWQPRACVDACT